MADKKGNCQFAMSSSSGGVLPTGSQRGNPTSNDRGVDNLIDGFSGLTINDDSKGKKLNSSSVPNTKAPGSYPGSYPSSGKQNKNNVYKKVNNDNKGQPQITYNPSRQQAPQEFRLQVMDKDKTSFETAPATAVSMSDSETKSTVADRTNVPINKKRILPTTPDNRTGGVGPTSRGGEAEKSLISVTPQDSKKTPNAPDTTQCSTKSDTTAADGGSVPESTSETLHTTSEERTHGVGSPSQGEEACDSSGQQTPQEFELKVVDKDKTSLETEEPFDRIPVLGKEDIEIACYTDGTILFPSKDTHIEESNLIQTLVTENFTWSNLYQSALTENKIPFCIWRKVENEQGVHFQSTDTDESTYRQKMKQLVHEADLKVHKVNYSSEGKHILLLPFPSVIKAKLVTIYKSAKGNDLYFIGLKQKVNIALKEYGLVYLENHVFPFEASFEMPTGVCRALACFSECLKTDYKSIIFQPFPQEGRLVCAASSVFEIETAIKKIDSFIASLEEKELDMPSYRRLLLQAKQAQMYVQENLGRRKIACFLDCSPENVKVTCTSKENLNEAEKLIKNCIAETKIGSDKRTEFEKLVDLYEGKMQISCDTEKDILIVVYTHDVSDAVLSIVSDTAKPFYSLSPSEREFLSKHCAEELQKIQNEYNVEIRVQGEGLNIQSNSNLNAKNVGEAIRKLLPRCTSVIRVGQKANDFVSSEEGKTCITQLADKNKAICTLQNAEDAEEDACDNVLCSWYCGTKGQQILLVQGRAADLFVDCLVIPVNGSIIPLTSEEHGIEGSEDDAVKHEVSDHSMDKGRHLLYSEWWIGKHRGKLRCGTKLYLPVESKKGFIEQNDLREQLLGVFVKATELQYESIGLPLELFDSQKRRSYTESLLTAAVEATIMFLSKEGNGLSSVYLCTCEKKTIDLRIQKIERTFQDMKDSKFIFFVKKAKKMLKGKKADLKCSVHVGKLHEEKVNVLVNTVAKNLDLKNGYVSVSILHAAGQEIQNDLKDNHPNGIQSMEIILTRSYQLKRNGCHYILHLALEELGNNILEKMNALKALTFMCLEKADDLGMSSIAFPALGTGKLGYPYRDVAWAMFEAVEGFNPAKQNLKEVKFIVYEQDMKTIEAFRLEEWRRKHLSRPERKMRRVPDTIKGYLESKQRLDFEITIQSDIVKASKVVQVKFKIKKEISSESRLKYQSAYALGRNKKLYNDAYEVEIKDDKTDLGLGVKECIIDAVDKRVSHLMFHLSGDMKSTASHEQCKHIIDTIIQVEPRYLHHVDICVASQAEFKNIQDCLQAEMESRATKSWFKSIPRTLTQGFFSKEVKWTFCQSQVKKSNQLLIQLLSNAQDHLQNAEQAIRMKLKAINKSSDLLMIPSVFEKGTAQLNTAVYRSMKEGGFLQEWIKSVEAQHGFQCEENEQVVKITGQVEKLLHCQEWIQGALNTGCLQIKMDEDEYILLCETDFVTKYIGLIKAHSYSRPEMIITYKREKRDEIQKAFDERLESLRKNEKYEIKLETTHEVSKVREYLKNLDVDCFVKQDDLGILVVMWTTYEEHVRQKNKLMVVLGLRETTKKGRQNRQYTAGKVRLPVENETYALDNAILKGDSPMGKAFETEEGLIIRVYKGDITKLDVDCLVNAANEQISNGAGVAKAIEDAAGLKYKEECTRSVQVYGPLKEGDVRFSTGGDLNCKQILNAVGPRWDSYADKTHCQEILRETIKKCLEESNGRGYKTVALPSLSAGLFRVPLEKCTQEYCQAVISFSKETPREARHLEEVHFVDINQKTVDVIHRAFSELLRKCFTDVPLSQNSPSSLDKMTFSIPLTKNQTMDVSDSAVSRRFTSLANTLSIQQGELMNHQYMKKTLLQNTADQDKTSHSGSSVLNQGNTGQKLKTIRIQPVAGCEMEMVIKPQKTKEPDNSAHLETQQSGSGFLLKMEGTIPNLVMSSEGIPTQFPFFTVFGRRLQIYAAYADITAISVDAIVSTEDPYLSGKGAIAGAIRKVAGDGFDRNEFEIARSKTPLDMCSVVATRVRHLHCKFVLHTISPHWDKQAVKDPRKFEASLSLAVLNILKTAEENKLESVAIPLLGTSGEGKNDTPVPTCARGMINGFLNFLKYEPQRSITHIEFVSNNPGVVKVFFDTLHQHSDQVTAGKLTESGLKNKNGEFGSDEMSASAGSENCLFCNNKGSGDNIQHCCEHGDEV